MQTICFSCKNHISQVGRLEKYHTAPHKSIMICKYCTKKIKNMKCTSYRTHSHTHADYINNML